MNLVLHYSLKDLRWLWPRVVVLLLALSFDFVVQMEWLWPLSSRPTISFPAALWSVPMWIIAWWLLLCVPPEEGGLSFRSTRPVSRLHYWLSRILTSVVAVMLPLMIENAVVLLAHCRPWMDVGRGLLETGLAVAVSMLWLLPAGTLFRGWEKYAVLVLFIYFDWDGGPTWLFEKLQMPYREAWRFMWYDSGLMLRCGACTGVLMLGLAAFHAHRPMGRLLRLALPVVMGMLWTLPAMFPAFPSAIEAAKDAELVKKLAHGRELRVDASGVEVKGGSDSFELNARLEFDDLPPGILPYWHVEKRRVMQDGKELPDVAEVRLGGGFPSADDIAYLPFWKPLAPHVPGAWAADTLVRTNVMGMTRLATLARDVDTTKPLTMELQLSAQWARLRELGRMPLKKGAMIHTPESEIEVLEVLIGADNRGNERPAALTLRLRERHVTFAGRNVAFPFMPHLCLYAPEKRLLWQQASDGPRYERGTNHGWSTFQREITFLWPVLEPGTGVTKENLEKQKLVWIGGEYLGSSRHELKVENVELGKHWNDKPSWPRTKPALVSENPRVAFHEQVKRIPRPAETASREEFAHYMAQVYQAADAFAERHDTLNDGEAKWPGNDLEMQRQFVPLFLKHPDLFRAALQYGDDHFITGVVHEALLQAGIPGISRSEKTGEPRYERVTPVPGKPEQTRTRVMETLWLASWNPDSFDAYVAAIQQRSDEPLWPLMEEKGLTDDEVLADFAKRFDPGWLRLLMRRPEARYREQADKLTREAFARLPMVTELGREDERRLQSAVALGMPEALEWLLRVVALKDEHHPGTVLMEHNAMFETLGGTRPNSKALAAFIDDARRFSAKDFRYDAKTMRWELIHPTKP
jgi:hypothetical protein